MALQKLCKYGNQPTRTLSNMCSSADTLCGCPNSHEACLKASTRPWVAGRLLGGARLLCNSLIGHHGSPTLLCLRCTIGSSGPLNLLQLGRIVKVFRLRLVPNHLILQAEPALSLKQHCAAAVPWRWKA